MAILVVSVCSVVLAGPAQASSWTSLPGGQIDYHAVDFVDVSHGWVGGVTFTPAGQAGIEPTAIIGRTDSGGADWQYSTSHEAGDVAFGWNFLTAATIDFVDDLHGWAALSDGAIVATTTGGAHWAVQAEGSSEFRDNNWSYVSLSMADATHGVAVGSWVGFIGVTYPRIVYTHDGHEWKAADFPKPDNSSLESVCMVDSEYGWAVGSAGLTDSTPLVLVTHDGGATWTRQTKGLPTTGIDLHGVSFVDRQHGWAVGDFGAIYVTVDGGATWWSQPSVVSATLRGVHFSDSSTGWAVGDKSTILETTQAGRLWIPGTLPVMQASVTLRAVSTAGGHVWAVGDGGVILTAAAPQPGSGGMPFTDIDDSSYKTAIESLAAAGLVGGFPDGTFRPDATVLRQQFAKIIVGALGIVPGDSTATRFTDLGKPDADGYPHRYVQAAFDRAITNGVDAAQTRFAPWNPIRRDQAVSMIVRGAKSLMAGVLVGPPPGTPSLFADVGEPHGENLRIAEYNGLLNGLTGLGPAWNVGAYATRGEVAQMLYNLRGGSTTSAGGSEDSGIRGLVTIGPISPVERPGEPTDRPYAATIVIERVDGTTAAETKSGGDGRFSVNLAPGSYVLEPQNGNPLPIARPQHVTVAPHTFTEVTVEYDSGIR